MGGPSGCADRILAIPRIKHALEFRDWMANEKLPNLLDILERMKKTASMDG